MSIISSRHIFKWRVSKSKSVYLADEEKYEPFIFEQGESGATMYTLKDDTSTSEFPVVSSATSGDIDENAIAENVNNIGVMEYNVTFKKMLKLLSYDPDGAKMVFNDYFSYYNVYDNVSMPTEKEEIKMPLDVIVRSYGQSGATVYLRDSKEVLDITGEAGEGGYTIYLTNPTLYPSRKSTQTDSGNTFYTDVIVFKGAEDISGEITIDQQELERGKSWPLCDGVWVEDGRHIKLKVNSGSTEEEQNRHYGYVDIPVTYGDFSTTVRWNYEIVELLLSSGTSIYQTYSSTTMSFEDYSGRSNDFIMTADGLDVNITNSALSASTQISLTASGLMVSMKEGWNHMTFVEDATGIYESFTGACDTCMESYVSNMGEERDESLYEIGTIKSSDIRTASSVTETFLNTASNSETVIREAYNGLSTIISQSGTVISDFEQAASQFTGDFFSGPTARTVFLSVIDSADTYVYKSAEISDTKDMQYNGYELIIKNASGQKVTTQALSGLKTYKIGETSLDTLSKIGAENPFAITVVGTTEWEIQKTGTGKCYFAFPEDKVDINSGLSITFRTVNRNNKDLAFTIDVYDAYTALTEYGHFRLGYNEIDILHENIDGYVSEVNMEADQITSRVSNLEGDVSEMRQDARSITLMVSGRSEDLDEIEASVISINKDTNYFSAPKIVFDGYTSINGGVAIDKNGKMTLNDVEFDGVFSDKVHYLAGNTSSAGTEYVVQDSSSVYCPVDEAGEKTKVYLPCEPYYNGRTITVINSSTVSHDISGTTQIFAGRTLGKNVFASLYAEQNSDYSLDNDNASDNYCVFVSDGSDFNISYDNVIDFAKDKTTDALMVGWSLCESLGYGDHEKGEPLTVYGDMEDDKDINWQFGNVYENGDPSSGLAEEIEITNESVDLTGVLSNRKGILPKYQYEIKKDGTPFIYNYGTTKLILPVLRKI